LTYRIELSPAARRALTHTLPESVAAACANFLHEVLAVDPHRVGKPLRDVLAGRYSARRGEFRVIYEIHDDVVVVRVISIRHRRDAYA
jgi:mRNA-degrading endonuclease RelE of RelBE toxin-antitoxin system